MRLKPKGTSGKTRKRSYRARLGVFVGLVVLVIGFVAAFTVPRNSSHASPKKYKATKEIILDQATGTLRKPTTEETETMVSELTVLTNRSTAGLTVTPGARGSQVMDLEGRFGGVALGRANPDGSIEVKCVFTMEEAEEFLGLEEDQ
jgi:hypothetical protein